MIISARAGDEPIGGTNLRVFWGQFVAELFGPLRDIVNKRNILAVGNSPEIEQDVSVKPCKLATKNRRS